jgi:cytochrome c-type biogenesis protein CcmH/NrfG
MGEPIGVVLDKVARLSASGRRRKAVALLRITANAHPGRHEVWCRLAAAHLDRGEATAALVAARRALPLPGDQAWAHRLASKALSRLDRHAEAVAAARQAIRVASGEWRCWIVLAEAYGAAGSWPDAVDAAIKAVRYQPDQVRPYLVLGDAARRTGDVKTAELAYRTALRRKPGDARVRAELTRLRQAAPPRSSRERPRTEESSEQVLPEQLCWRGIRQLSITLVVAGMLLLVAGLPRPTPMLAWPGFAVPCVVILFTFVALARVPAGSRFAVLLMPFRRPVVALSCALLLLSTALVLLWATLDRADAGTMEPLVFALVCAVCAGAASLVNEM